MKLRSAIFLFFTLALLIMVILLLFLGYIPFPMQNANANGKSYYLTVRTNIFGIVDIPGEGWYQCCIYVDLDAPQLANVYRGVRYTFVYWDVDGTPQETGKNQISVHMDGDHIATAYYERQYYLAMFTNYGTVTPDNGWYDAGSVVTINAFPPETILGERYVWNSWTGIGEGHYTGNDKEASVIMNGPINETASWTHQYYLTAMSPYGTAGGEGWYDNGETAFAALDKNIVDHGNGTRRLFTSWSGHATGTTYSSSDPILMDAPKTAIANWKTQYYLTVTSPYGTTDGEGWHDNGSTAYAMLDSDAVNHGNGTRQLFTSWGDDASGTDYTQSNPILMDVPKTAIANWKTQYILTATADLGGSTNPSGFGWHDSGSTVSVFAIPDTDYSFDHWELDDADAGSSNPYGVLMDTAHTLHAVFKSSPPPPPIYYLTVRTNPPDIVSIFGEGWYDEGEIASLVAPPYVEATVDARYRFDHWDIDGIPQTAGVNQINVKMDANHTATAHYVRQFYLTVRTSPAGIVDIPGEGWYEESTNVSLSAPQVEGYNFMYWDIDATTAYGPSSIIVNMNSPHIATATYRRPITVIGGTTVSLKNSFVPVWMVLNIFILATLFSAGIILKKKRRQN